jgi:hypothetical protein
MELKAHLYRLENIKAIHDLATAGIDHQVISVFLSAEGICITPIEVTNIVNTYDALGKEKVPTKKYKPYSLLKKSVRRTKIYHALFNQIQPNKKPRINRGFFIHLEVMD